jgi:hypothetical protein
LNGQQKETIVHVVLDLFDTPIDIIYELEDYIDAGMAFVLQKRSEKQNINTSARERWKFILKPVFSIPVILIISSAIVLMQFLPRFVSPYKVDMGN